MLAINNVQLNVANKTLVTVADLQFKQGEFVALLGPNGAGKSTLIKALAGEQDYTGEIILHGTALNQWPLNERAAHVGVLPQSGQLTFPFLAHEVVALGLLPLTISAADGRQRVKQAMQQCQCEQLYDRPFPQLSGGEKQRVHLARVLVQISQASLPPVLLLDEPVSAQDLLQQHLILSLAKSLAEQQQAIVVAVLHDLNQALRYCHRCVVLKSGEQVSAGAPEQVLSETLIKDVWGYQAAKVESAQGAVLI